MQRRNPVIRAALHRISNAEQSHGLHIDLGIRPNADARQLDLSCTNCSQQWHRICCHANLVRLSPGCLLHYRNQNANQQLPSHGVLLQILSDIFWTEAVTARKMKWEACLLCLAEFSASQGISIDGILCALTCVLSTTLSHSHISDTWRYSKWGRYSNLEYFCLK